MPRAVECAGGKTWTPESVLARMVWRTPDQKNQEVNVAAIGRDLPLREAQGSPGFLERLARVKDAVKLNEIGEPAGDRPIACHRHRC